MASDHELIGKVGHCVSAIEPGHMGEVMVPVRGGSECYFAYSSDPAESIGVLVDTTMCVGCRLCEFACKKSNGYETGELARRERLYRAGQPELDLTGRIAIVIDDGLATGATARAAVAAVRQLGAKRVVLAVPVGAAEALQQLTTVADQVICPVRPAEFGAVSRHYEDFGQVSDAEVVSLLHAV